VLRTRFTEMFGLSYPVMAAPMTLHSGPTLAAAVSACGALGSFGGVNTSVDQDQLRSQIAAVRRTTDRPFAVGFLTHLLPTVEPLFETALAERPAAIALSFGDPGPWVRRCQAEGIPVICQVQHFDAADQAVAAGADVLVAQGNEAGGHTGTMGLLPLLTGVVGRHPDHPVLAAGGIGDGVSLAAALTAGADGAWLGTRLLATPEAVEVDEGYKRFIVDSDGTDTVFTRVYDILSPFVWPAGIGERVHANRFTDEWRDREEELDRRKDELALERAPLPSSPTEPAETREVLYGQSAQFVHDVRPAADVIRSICDDAERHLRTRPPSLFG